MTGWAVTPEALAAVSAGALVVMAIASCLGRNVYDELLRDVRERTRDNGWEPVAAFAEFYDVAPSAPAADDDAGVENERDAEIADVSDGRIEAAVADAWAEARAQAAAEIDRIKLEAQLRHEADLRDVREAAAAELERVTRETEAAIAVNVAGIQAATPAIDLTDSLEKSEKRIADARAEVQAAADRQRAAAVLEAATAAKTEAALELARVKQAGERALAEAKGAADAELSRIKQAADRTLAAKLDEARAASDRQRAAAVLEATTAANAAAEAELVRVKQAAARMLAAKLEEVRAESDRQRSAAVSEALAAAKLAAGTELARLKEESEAQLARAKQESAAELNRVKQEAEIAVSARVAAAARASDAPPPRPAAPVIAPFSERVHQTLEEHLREARSKVARPEKKHLARSPQTALRKDGL